VVQWHLAAEEAEPLCVVRPGPGGVELQLVPDRPAEELVDRLLPDLAKQVVEGEVNGADGVQDDPLRP